jgi:SPP1 gp7 family putative phage head morphogenesis protein
MKPNPFVRYTAAFSAKWDGLSPTLQDEIRAELDKGFPPVVAVQTVFERHNLKQKLGEWISEGCVSAAQAGGVSFASDLTGRYFFLEKSFDMTGVSLSQRVTQLKFQENVVSTIQANLASQGRFNTLVTDLSQYTTEETLPKGLLELERQARRVMSGDVEAFDEFQTTLSHERSVALSALEDGNETVLKRSYARLVDAAEKLNDKGLDAAVEEAIDQKARSAAFRIAHTEMARAYGMAVKTDAKNDPECVGVEWTLSSAENHCDDCEEMDGKVFAVDEVPPYPLHPHCSCHLDKYYGDPENLEDMGGEETDDATIPDELLTNGEEG